MSNPTDPTAATTRPSPIDLSGIDPRHPEQESAADLIGVAVAETAAGGTGLHHLRGLASRTLDRAQRRLLGSSRAPGVTVSDDRGTTTIDLDVVAEYPQPIAPLVEELRTQVTHAARQITSGPIAVNIVVTDVHGPFDADPAVLDVVDEGAARVADARDAAAATARSLQDDLGAMAETAGDAVQQAAAQPLQGSAPSEPEDRTTARRANQALHDAADAMGDADLELERLRSATRPSPTDGE